MVARDRLSGMNPQYWYFWIGLLLVGVVLFLPNGVLGGLAAATAESGTSATRLMTVPALRTTGLHKSFGSLVVAQDVALRTAARRARYALIGPNGAGKTTLINLITGALHAECRADHPRRGGHHRARATAPRQARPDAHLPDQHAVSRA